MAKPKRVALITGGARGIGLGIARALARDGLALALCGRRSEPEATEALAELSQAGAEVLYVQADISQAKARQQLIDAVRQRFGRLNVLVNNAGVAPEPRQDILQASEASFERLIRINLQGPYFLTQLAGRWLIEQRQADPSFAGCVVNITSISATVASVDRGDYCLTKAALAMSTKLWAARLAEFGLSVYEVRPGLIRTDMSAPASAKYDRLIAKGLLLEARWGEAQDVGKAVAALVRGELPYATGAVLTLDGGLTLPRL